MLKSLIKRALPPSLQTSLRQSALWTNRQSRSLAKRSKRLDLCAVELAHHLKLSGIDSLEDRVCLELGSGWLLSHALAMYLLGARRVYATDIAAIAQPQHLKIAVQASIPSVIRDQLAQFSSHAAVRERMKRLLGISRFSFDVLRDLNIEYVAPIDLAEQKYEHPVDFIYSVSVMEHVVQKDIPPLLANLTASLRPGGEMIHAIHLEDHRDFQHHPFEFYSVPGEKYSSFDQSIRGNRVRYSQWLSMLGQLAETESRATFRFQREDVTLPRIDASILNTGEEDLRTSHLGILIRKNSRH